MLKRLLFVILLVGHTGCSPTAPTRTCLDPRVVVPSTDGKTVGIPDTHGNIHFVPTTLPICRPDELH